MKTQTFFRLALLFPYGLWIICMIVIGMTSNLMDVSDTWQALMFPFAIYALGAFIWFVPYTLLAIGLGFWSRNKSTTALSRAGLLSPLLLFPLLVIEAVVIYLPADNAAQILESLQYGALLGGFGLVFGYLCVGVVFGIFKLLQAKQFIAPETPPPAAS